MKPIKISWDKYIEVQTYLLANLDILTFKLSSPDEVNVYFYNEEDAVVFKLRYSL